MPYKPPPKCVQCGTTETQLWRNLDLGIFCCECYEKNESGGDIAETVKKEEADKDKGKDGDTQENTDGTTTTMQKGKKNTRARASKVASKDSKGKSRRCIFKRQPFKTPTVTVTTHTTDSVFYGNIYLQKGDIVCLQDEKDNLYYAQIKSFLVDTYLEKSAYITWLIPSKLSPPPNKTFDPCTYLLGPDEDFARKLSTMEFVMHAPSDYYLTKNAPYPTKEMAKEKTANYVWANLNVC